MARLHMWCAAPRSTSSPWLATAAAVVISARAWTCFRVIRPDLKRHVRLVHGICQAWLYILVSAASAVQR
jgi:hypothetical protein